MDQSETNRMSDEQKWQALTRHEKLGEILLKLGKLNLSQLNELMQEKNQSEEHLGELVVKKGLMTKEELMQALELQHKSDMVGLESVAELKEKHHQQ